MRQTLRISKILIFFSLFITLQGSWKKPELISLKNLQLSKRIKESLKNSPYAKSNIKSFKHDDKELQSLDFLVAGLHKKTCRFALVKVSQYERFKDFISFIKESRYNEKTKKLFLQLSHPLLPFAMTLHFKLPRITNEGITPFLFDSGFLKGLLGEIHVSSSEKRCLFVAKARWKGPHTGINNTLFSLFSETLGKMGMTKVLRFSSTL